MVTFLWGALAGSTLVCLVAISMIELRARKEKKAEEEEQKQVDWLVWKANVHDRINNLRADFTKNAAENGTSISILTARTSNIIPYVDACIERHEAAFHAPKSTKGDKKRRK